MAIATSLKPVPPQAEEDRIRRDTKAVIARLNRLLRPEGVHRWLMTRNDLFGGQTPLEAIREGRTPQVMESLVAVEEGLYV